MAFDITKYAATSERVEWEDLDFSAFDERPLSQQTLRSLHYMCDIEYHTVCYMRDMLTTPSHRESEVSTFMTMWNREEYWHGEALAAVLNHHGIEVTFDALKSRRLKLGWRDKLAPVKQALAGNLVGGDFVAVHMSWGALNEWSASAAYKHLAKLEDHPALSPLLRRIGQQETRHVAFYTTQARDRLEKSAMARKLTRLALSKFWGPVGSGVMPDEAVRHVMGHIFGTPDGMNEIRKIDDHVAKLPGLEGLQVVTDSFAALGVEIRDE